MRESVFRALSRILSPLIDTSPMATKKRRSEAQNAFPKFTGKICVDCDNAKDWHCKALDGRMIFCKCIYHTEGKWSQFLSAPACPHFVQREEIGNE